MPKPNRAGLERLIMYLHPEHMKLLQECIRRQPYMNEAGIIVPLLEAYAKQQGIPFSVPFSSPTVPQQSITTDYDEVPDRNIAHSSDIMYRTWHYPDGTELTDIQKSMQTFEELEKMNKQWQQSQNKSPETDPETQAIVDKWASKK